MKDLIIGSSDVCDWKDLRNWILSIKQSGFDGDIVVILYRHSRELLAKLKEYKVISIIPEYNWKLEPLSYDQRESENHVCQRRFFHIWQYLEQTNETYRYVIHNDVRDVIYQTNPSVWLSKHLIPPYKFLAPSEGILFKNESWGTNDFINAFGPFLYKYYAEHEEVINAGTFAGTHDFIQRLCLLMFITSTKKSKEAADQASLNLLINLLFKEHTLYGTLQNGWSCQCEIMLDPSNKRPKEHLLGFKPTIDSNGMVRNNTDLVVLVHQYNRDGTLNKLINNRYHNI